MGEKQKPVTIHAGGKTWPVDKDGKITQEQLKEILITLRHRVVFYVDGQALYAE